MVRAWVGWVVYVRFSMLCFLSLAWYGSQSEAGVVSCLWLRIILRYPFSTCVSWVFIFCSVFFPAPFRTVCLSFYLLFQCSITLLKNMDTYHAAHWSSSSSTHDERYTERVSFLSGMCGPVVFIPAYYCLYRWTCYLQVFGNCSEGWSRLVYNSFSEFLVDLF